MATHGHEHENGRLAAATRWGSLGILGALAGCVATGRGATEIERKTYDIDGLSALSLVAVNGSVTVDGNRGDEIVVRGRKAALTESSLESLALESHQWRPGDFLVHAPTPVLSGPDPGWTST